MPLSMTVVPNIFWMLIVSLVLLNIFSIADQLTFYLRKKTIFDDKPVEIQELTFIIKEDIANLNKQIAQLQQVYLA